MFIYFYQTNQGAQYICGFHKLETAINYALNQITVYLKNDLAPKKKQKVKNASYVGGQQVIFDNNPLARPVGQQPRAVFPNLRNMLIGENLHIQRQPIADKIDSIEENKEEIIDELKYLLAHLEVAIKNKTFDNTIKAMELYDVYIKTSFGDEPIIHSLQEIKIAG